LYRQANTRPVSRPPSDLPVPLNGEHGRAREDLARLSLLFLSFFARLLEREFQPLIDDWLRRVELKPELTRILLNHLPHLLHDVIARLRFKDGKKALGAKGPARHGDLRQKQGYTVATVVEESRLLQVTIFSMPQKNENHLDFALLLPDVVIIASEVEAELKKQLLRFTAAEVAGRALLSVPLGPGTSR